MAHQTHPSANRFAHHADHSNEYDSLEDFYHSETQRTAMPLPDQMPSRISEINDHPTSNGMPHILAAELKTSIPQAPLRTHVERVVREYFAALGDELPTDLYALILKEIELPLLTVTLEQTRGNQTKCAQILGLNRGTLRKKLKTYGLMS